jgi:hypothetical protein
MASPHTSRFGMPEIRTAAEAGGAATSAPARTARTARRVMTCMIPGMDAKEIIDANRYMTLATADAQGTPWASPVWFAHRE